MGKTKFQMSWQQNWTWLLPDKSNVYLAHCTACNFSLNVESGVGVIQRHEKVDKHLKRLNDVNSPATCASSGQNFFMKRGNAKVVLTSEQQVWNAVTVCTLMWLKVTFLLTCAMRTMIYVGACFLIQILPKIIVRILGKQSISYSFSVYQGTCAEWSPRPAFYTPFWWNNKWWQKRYDGYASYFSLKHKEISSAYCGFLYTGKYTPGDVGPLSRVYEQSSFKP